MKINNNIFSALVAASGAEFTQVSENYAKHLPYHHNYSTKRNPADQASGMLAESELVCNDGVFFANERIASYMAKTGLAADYPANGEYIAMCEWPTRARIRDILAYATTGNEDPVSYNTDYFTANTSAAFPGFSLLAIDPEDTTFELPLLENFTDTINTADASTTVAVVTQRLSLAARIYGVNKKPYPLIIAAKLTGSVVADSGLMVMANFAVPGC